MKIMIITQNAPLYLPLFMDDFLNLISNTKHKIKGVVVLSSLFKKSFLKEVYDRYKFYGLIDFFKMSFLIAKWKMFSLFPMKKIFSLKKAISKYNLKEYKVDSINSDQFINLIKKENIDLVISVASSQILKKELIKAPKKGCINYHTSLLPEYRGRMPLFWALKNKEKEIGISVHEVDEEIDNGPIIVQKRILTEGRESLHKLYLKTIEIGPEVLLEAVNKIDQGIEERILNDKNNATYFGFPDCEDVKEFKLKGNKFF